jgi:hypothetical protein
MIRLFFILTLVLSNVGALASTFTCNPNPANPFRLEINPKLREVKLYKDERLHITFEGCTFYRYDGNGMGSCTKEMSRIAIAGEKEFPWVEVKLPDSSPLLFKCIQKNLGNFIAKHPNTQFVQSKKP